MTSKRIIKALNMLNAYVDDDRQKLCDRLHDMELSHKRMERLLRISFNALKNYRSLPTDTVVGLMVRIDRELSYPYFRCNERIKK